MRLRWLGVCLAAAAAMAAQSASAQPVRSCPEGQAVQALHPNGTPVRCVPVPQPVDLAPLQAQISAEKNAREAADDALRGSIGNEASIVGRYTFSGTQVCLSSTTGFNDDLTPRQATLPNTAAVVSQFTAITTGSRTFEPNGTGTAEFFSHFINYPGVFYHVLGSIGFTNGGVGPNGLNLPGGSASTAVQTGTFNWHIEDGRLFIEDRDVTGTIVFGGPRTGWSNRSLNMPRAVGVLGKDLRLITITHEEMKVESAIFTSPGGTQVIESLRICNRERTLRKV